MEIKPVNNQSDWDGWLEENTRRQPFSQSWAWGEILLSENKQVDRIAVEDKGKRIAQTQIIYQKLPWGWQYGFSGQGPVFKDSPSELPSVLLKYLESKGNIFWRLEPAEDLSAEGETVSQARDINPRATVILDISKAEQKILQEMKAKTRYNIGLAQRKGLTIENKKDLSGFIKLSEQTARRDKFSLHPRAHYEAVLRSDISYQLSAVYKNKCIASNVFVGFGNTFTYLYGASSYEHRNLMAPYLLQWEGIRLAKSLGYKFYDFFGIAPARSAQMQKKSYQYDPKHQYAGVTRFKLGFGGQTEEKPGTFDLILDGKKYFVYKFLRKLRRLF